MAQVDRRYAYIVLVVSFILRFCAVFINGRQLHRLYSTEARRVHTPHLHASMSSFGCHVDDLHMWTPLCNDYFATDEQFANHQSNFILATLAGGVNTLPHKAASAVKI